MLGALDSVIVGSSLGLVDGALDGTAIGSWLGVREGAMLGAVLGSLDSVTSVSSATCGLWL